MYTTSVIYEPKLKSCTITCSENSYYYYVDFIIIESCTEVQHVSTAQNTKEIHLKVVFYTTCLLLPKVTRFESFFLFMFLH